MNTPGAVKDCMFSLVTTRPLISRVANVTVDGGRNKVLFQEPLSHAPVGQWIKSGDLRYQKD